MGKKMGEEKKNHPGEMQRTTRNKTNTYTKFEDKHNKFEDKYKGIALQKRPGLTDQEQRSNGPVTSINTKIN